MDNIKDLIEKIIPSDNYAHRNGFTNYSIIDNLT